MLGALRKLLTRAPTPAPQSARVEASERGLRETCRHAARDFSWDELTSIRLVWSENPWGDPWLGPYCDTDWSIDCANGQRMSLFDEDENRRVILPAFEKFLPGFDFDYAAFDRLHNKRSVELEGGEYLVWQRDI